MSDGVIDYPSPELQIAADDVARTVSKLLTAQETLQTSIRSLKMEWEGGAKESWDRSQHNWDEAERACHSAMTRFGNAITTAKDEMVGLDRILASQYDG